VKAAFEHLAKAREWKAKSRAIREEQQRWAKRRERIRGLAGKSLCELCLQPAKLVTWDERARPGELSQGPGRNPIWRICRECYEVAVEARGLLR